MCTRLDNLALSGLVAENDSTARQVVRRHFDRDAVTLEHADAKSPHVAAEGREHGMSIGQLHTERCVRQHFRDLSFQLYWFFLGHETSVGAVWSISSIERPSPLGKSRPVAA